MAAEAAVSMAVETLGKLLIEKAVFLTKVKGDVEWVRDELKSMQCFLKDAAKKESESIRKWISDIREVAHDAEDAIEIFSLKVDRKGLKKRYGCFPNHLHHLSKVGEQIASIRQKLKDIDDRRVRYDIQKDVAESSTRTKAQEEIETRRRLPYWKPDDQHVVGFEEDVKLLLGKAVFGKSKGLSVAAILGMGGSGKSTLASKIYNHPAVADGGFEFKAWVVVSSEFNPEDVMKHLLKQLGISVDLGSIADRVGRQEELKKELHQHLTGKRYFIVLDDVWEPHHWESLSTAFPADGDNDSRLLLTSRNPIITDNNGYVHNMKPLDANYSWDLFIRKALGGNNNIEECPEELKEIGKEILKKCGGLPLAINVVGGLLAKKARSKTEWEKVVKEMKYHLEKSKDLNNIAAILELSYHNLPLELKACFLCFGFFREDFIINVKDLVHTWVAQGLVAQEVEREDVARDYLNELISRNMVKVRKMSNIHDKVKYCQMHDLLRDLSIRKVKEEIDFEEVREEHNSHQSLAKPRHRAIYCNELSFDYSTRQNKHLRSLFIHIYQWETHSDSGGPSSYWKSFELLRILDLGFLKFRVFPKGIGELAGLRYLKMLYKGDQLRLPSSWAKLKNLEILDLGNFSNGIILDKVILKMENLRHLFAIVKSCKASSGNLRKLQTLHMFQVENSSDVRKIQGMRGVSKLGITMFALQETDSLFRCLSSFENLSNLTLSGFLLGGDLGGLTSLHRVTRFKLSIDSVIGPALPVKFPPNLSHLSLSLMKLYEDTMPILEKLPNLGYLKIYRVETDGLIMVITSGGFPRLKVLHIKNTRYIRKMEIEEGAMPELNQFIIRKCPNLNVENLPERIKSAIIVQAR